MEEVSNWATEGMKRCLCPPQSPQRGMMTNGTSSQGGFGAKF